MNGKGNIFLPWHFLPLIDNLKPLLHMHLKVSAVSMHFPFLQTPTMNLHSFLVSKNQRIETCKHKETYNFFYQVIDSRVKKMQREIK